MKTLVVCDIDQTIALDTHRTPEQGPQALGWYEYMAQLMDPAKIINDPAIPETVLVVKLLAQVPDTQLVFLTSRKEPLRDVTIEWIKKTFPDGLDAQLVMRQPEDRSKDVSYKTAALRAFETLYHPESRIVIDDDYTHTMESTYKAMGYVMFKVIAKFSPNSTLRS